MFTTLVGTGTSLFKEFQRYGHPIWETLRRVYREAIEVTVSRWIPKGGANPKGKTVPHKSVFPFTGQLGWSRTGSCKNSPDRGFELRSFALEASAHDGDHY